MTLQINDFAPDFEADTTEGHVHLHDWIGNSWAVLFSHPKDFTPCARPNSAIWRNLEPAFDRRNTKVIVSLSPTWSANR